MGFNYSFITDIQQLLSLTWLVGGGKGRNVFSHQNNQTTAINQDVLPAWKSCIIFMRAVLYNDNLMKTNRAHWECLHLDLLILILDLTRLTVFELVSL